MSVSFAWLASRVLNYGLTAYGANNRTLKSLSRALQARLHNRLLGCIYNIWTLWRARTYLNQVSGYFFHDKMPGYCLPGQTAATVLQFIACPIQHPLSQKPTASFAYPGGSSQLLIRSTGAIILA